MRISMILGLLTGAATVFAGFFFYFYNRFVRSKTKIREALGNVDMYLSHRQDYLSQLRAVVARHDQQKAQTVETAIHAGQSAREQGPVPDRANRLEQANRLTQTVMKEVRKIPDLNKTAEFNRIMQDLEKAEFEFKGAIRYYNALVREHNILVETFPSAIVAILLRFKKAHFLDRHHAA